MIRDVKSSGAWEFESNRIPFADEQVEFAHI